MTDTSACGRTEFHILWCQDCVSLIRSRFRHQVFDQVSTFGFGLRRSYGKKKKTHIITNATNPKGKVNTIVKLICAYKYFFLVVIQGRCIFHVVAIFLCKNNQDYKVLLPPFFNKFPFNRVSNQNWFLSHDHARLTRLVLRRAICCRINRFRLDLFRCYKSKSCCNLDSWVC